MAKHYAWSTFPTDVDEWGKAHGKIEPGEAVDAKMLDISDDEFETLVECGAVRTMKYPDVEPGQSPAEYYRAKKYQEMEMVMSASGVVEEVPAPPPPPEPKPDHKPQTGN